MANERDPEVLIIGAGPTGLVLAWWLTALGVRVRIIDKATEPGTTSRALAVQARTLELYRQLGLADTVVEHGRRAGAANLWVAGRLIAHVELGDIGSGLSPYPFALIYPQDEHERLLIERLGRAGVEVERGTTLAGFDQTGDRVSARLVRPDGSDERCAAEYVAGCDGAHSTVRAGLGIDFTGGTYEHLFYVADVEAAGAAMNGEVHVALDAADFVAVFPLAGPGRARLVGTVRERAAPGDESLSWQDVSKRVIDWMRIDVRRVHWFSTYHVHHRVAGQFRRGRAFLLGDAAHVHSPVGGQGMNTGIGDAVNLAWKLAASLRERADRSVLDTYETERIAFARRLVTTTDRAFTAVTSSSPSARLVRLHIVPRLLPMLFAWRPVRRLAFRTVSQTMINYRGSPLSEGRTGTVHGGDRLPWVSAVLNGVETDNFAPLTSLDWQVHVYGEADPQVRATCAARRLPLHVFPWDPEIGKSGLQRKALYLVRPDGHVALAAAAPAALESYLDRHRVTARASRENDVTLQPG